MKKAIVIALLLILIIGIAGCREKNGTGVVKPSKPAATANATQPKPAASGTPKANDTSAGTSEPEKTNIDLLITDAYFTPTFASIDEDVVLKFIVKNQGTEDSDVFDYSIKIYKGGSLWKEDKFTSTQGLLRGEDDKLTNPYVFTAAGTYSAEVFVDPDNSIGEAVETNNYKKAKADAIVT